MTPRGLGIVAGLSYGLVNGCAEGAMAGVEARIGRAAAFHREAAAVAVAVASALDRPPPVQWSATAEREVRELAERLRAAAALVAPGWLGAPLAAVPPTTPLGASPRPELVRIGTAYPLDDASFPVVVPFSHLAVDGDARDPRVAGLLRAVLLRLLATQAPGALRVRAVDPVGKVFAAFAALADAGIMPPPVTSRAGLCAALTELEQWVREGGNPGQTRLLVVAAWPQATEPVELARISRLASEGPAAGLFLFLAGWPPPLLGEDSTEPVELPAGGLGAQVTPGRVGPPLPSATWVALRNPHVLVGHPPGGSFSAQVRAGETSSSGLNARVYLDETPSVELIGRVCGEIATAAQAGARTSLGAVLPEGPLWASDPGAGLAVVIGRAGKAPVTLQLAAATPHWLVLGGAGSGRTALLLDIVYSLCGQYPPDRLHCYLLGDKDPVAFGAFVPRAEDPSYLPHARAVAWGPDRADAVAVLRRLATELSARPALGRATPRVVCVIDRVDDLLAGAVAPDGTAAPDGTDPLAREALALLSALANDGGAHGVHLVLTGQALPPPEVAAQCRVRIALPGGAAALDPANRTADALEVGTAVVNTAGGLGGPPRATRAHEQVVRFPDPYAGAVALAGLRHQLWRAAGGTQ